MFLKKFVINFYMTTKRNDYEKGDFSYVNYSSHSYTCNEYNDLICLADNFIEMKRFPKGDFCSSLFIQLKGGLNNKKNEKINEKES